MSRPGRAGVTPSLDARVIALAEANGAWMGGLDEIRRSDLELVPGRVDSRFGETHLRARSGAFELLLKSNAADVTARLRLEPMTLPLLRPKTAIGSAVVNWLAAPRLRATGSITGRGDALPPAQRARLPRPQLGSLALGEGVLLAMGLRLAQRRRQPVDRGLLSPLRSLAHDRARARAVALARSAPVPGLPRRRGRRPRDGLLAPAADPQGPARHGPAGSAAVDQARRRGVDGRGALGRRHRHAANRQRRLWRSSSFPTMPTSRRRSSTRSSAPSASPGGCKASASRAGVSPFTST